MVKKLFLLFILSCLSCCQSGREKLVDNSASLRIGWITTWATAGQVMEALSRTDIAAKAGLKLELKKYALGPQMNEAALHGDLDGIVIGVVPTVSLLSVDPEWKVVARLVDFNICTVVPKFGPIDITSLQGKRIGVPFGSGAHPYILRALLDAGISPDTAKLINIKPPEQVLALASDAIDAVASWEPVTTILQGKYAARCIHKAKHSGFLTVRKSLIQSRPGEVALLIKSMREAHLFNANNRKLVDTWYAADSGFDLQSISTMEVIEPNFSASSIEHVNIEISADVIAQAQEVADDMYKFNLTKQRVDWAQYTIANSP